MKAYVVTHDERESGLRGLLNFGHTAGHAIEAILAPELLHGEAVAVGMVKEAEVARLMGHLNQENLARLVRCLKTYLLPVSMEDSLLIDIQKRTGKFLPLDRLMEIMKVDKKNQGAQKRIVLLNGIGKTVEPKPSNVDDEVLRQILAPAIRVYPMMPDSKIFTVQVPGSKSISNRVLILAALSKGSCCIKGLLHSDDTQVMLAALEHLQACTYAFDNGGTILRINGTGGHLVTPVAPIYLGNAGTAVRFLTSVCTLISPSTTAGAKATIITGNARMQQRPIGPLVDALNSAGCRIQYVKNTNFPPLSIEATQLKGGTIRLSASISSQYVSSILLSAPLAKEPVVLDLGPPEEHVVSQPYIDMTIAMMSTFGVRVTRDPSNRNRYHIPCTGYKPPASEEYIVEPDASSATYPLAIAALTGQTVIVPNLNDKSCQGDAQFAWKFLEPMGCKVDLTEEGFLRLKGPPSPLRGLGQIDMESMTDAFLTASVVAAMASEGEETVIRGIANQRVKECNRIEAMVTELKKFGVEAWEVEDGIGIRGKGNSTQWKNAPIDGVHCYDDHRVAMSFSVLAAAFYQSPDIKDGVLIQEKKCVAKTWPTWWDTLQNVFALRCKGEDFKDNYEGNDEKIQTPLSADKSIIFVGMRGVGKTSLGKATAASLGWRFVDLDQFLEQSCGSSIAEMIKNEGWEAFRQYETDAFEKCLAQYPEKTIISSGGGIVETEANLYTLKNWIRNHGTVLHLKRDMNDVIQFLSQDPSRPSFGQDIESVWERRKPLYEQSSNLEFVCVKLNGEYQWKAIESALLRFIQQHRQPHALRKDDFVHCIEDVQHNQSCSFFVSLTFPNLRDYENLIPLVVEGADAVEFRVDLLKDPDDLTFVGEQLSLVRLLVDIPVIFTVRTKNQGGTYPDDRPSDVLRLLQAALKWGCEFIDIELGLPDDLLFPFKEQCEGRTLLIASYHDLSTLDPWNAPVMELMLRKAVAYGDIAKLIANASSIQDNMSLYTSIRKGSDSPLSRLVSKPLIAMNMGSKGQLSRILNHSLTPVTHSSMPSKAAPGQLSISEIFRARHLMGLLPRKMFYLFGSPIQKSCSPCLHNTGFEALGFPHTYQLFETDSVDSLKEVLESDSFGGASVTIPLKEKILKWIDRLEPAALQIGAVNTVMVEYTKEGGRKLVGDNTDYIGIQRCIRTFVSVPRSVLVLGAGGTARAACYAAKTMGCELWIWNRSTEKAQALATQFKGNVWSWDVTRETASSTPIDVMIATVPGHVHSEWSWLRLANEKVFCKTKGVYVEMAYTPRRTVLMENASSQGWFTVEGIDVLLEQGYEQFHLWTGRRAPRYSIRPRVLETYSVLQSK